MRRVASIPNTIQCPGCGDWIECNRGRIKLDNHIATEHPDVKRKQDRLRKKLLGPKPRGKEVNW